MTNKQPRSGSRKDSPTMEGGSMSASKLSRHVWVICLPLLWHVIASQSVEPHERIDTMGAYRLTNSPQCQRLCWYRRLCTSFNFKANTDSDKNCVLHSSHVEDANNQTEGTSSPGWTERTVQQPIASSSRPACAGSRPCGPAEVCGPQFSGSFRCLPLPAQCDHPETVAENAVEMPGTWVQGATATLQCLPDFVEVPRNVSMEIQCQVTSRWTGFNGECVQSVYRGAATVGLHGKSRLPWTAADGELRACVTGLYNASDRAYVNVLSGNDIILHVDFRSKHLSMEKMIVMSSRINGVWGEGIQFRTPAMPLEAGDSFSIGLHVTKDLVQLNMLRNHAQNVTWSASTSHMDLRLERAVSIVAVRKLSLEYVSLVDTCG